MRTSISHALPRLPVLGWAAFSGARTPGIPGVAAARYRRYTLSGQAAIGLALHLLGLKAGEGVLVPTYHCPTMVAPVVRGNLVAHWYPITESGAPNLEWLARADLRNVRAMLAAHFFGFPQPMAAVRAFCEERGIFLIEDCAHAFYGISDGRPVGTWGDFAIASLTKFFPVPEGGLLVSATRPMDSLRLRSRGYLKEAKAALDAIELGVRYRGFLGLNELLGAALAVKSWMRGGRHAPPVEAAAGAVDPAAYPSPHDSAVEPACIVRWITERVHQSRITEVRRRNYADLARRFSGMKGARALCPKLPEAAAPYVFPLYVEAPERSYQALRAAGVPIFRWDARWPGTPALEHDFGLAWSTHIFQLGCHQDLSPDDIAALANTVRSIIELPAKP